MVNTMREAPCLEQKNAKGLVHLYSGGGKGKTTAAVGLALRAVGQGWPVVVCQFLKGRRTGEAEPLRRLGVEIIAPSGSEKFFFQMDGKEKAAEAERQRRAFSEAKSKARSGRIRLLVLDEILDAVNLGLIGEEALTGFLADRPAGVEIVMTGRDPSPAICSFADYHTEFRCVRHPYQSGVSARPGIEY